MHLGLRQKPLFSGNGYMVDFSSLPKHLDDETRRRELLDIESKLVEHPFPPQLVIENTSICNLTCIHCSHRELIRKKRHMDRDLWNKIVEEVGRESPMTEIWPTFYGEALIMGYKNELWDRLDYADKVGCKNLVLNSNGTLLDRWDQIDRILNSPLKRFIISLDGLSKETFEKIREKAKWEEVYPAVERLCAERIRRGQKYPAITAQFSVMPANAHEVDDYRKYWNDRGAEVKVRPMLEWTATGTVRTDTIAHDREFRIACPWGNNTMAIHQDGSVVACAVDYEGRFKPGNVREISVKEAWLRLGEQLRKVHREHRWKDLPEICKGCGDWQVAGANYEEEVVEGTRPFWYYDEETKVADVKVDAAVKAADLI
jgi:radical SAM protein with 4Fe4S-binding SPASM domain